MKKNEKKRQNADKKRKKEEAHTGSKFNFYFPTAAISNTNATLRLNKTKQKSYLQIKESQGVSKKKYIKNPRTDLRSYI